MSLSASSEFELCTYVDDHSVLTLYEAAKMESISKDFIRKLVYEGKSHEEISEILKTTYPSIVRGLSVGSVRRFCLNNDIHRCKDSELDTIVDKCVSEVRLGI